MNILKVSFYGYNKEMYHFGKCFIVIKQDIFSISKIYKFSVSKGYFICSEIMIEKLFEKESCLFLNAYQLAKKDGLSFVVFHDSGNINMNLYNFPRFGESDFETIINSLGGNKISETENRTPDFVVNNIILELKDLQKESLENIDRQKSIAKIFKNINAYTINIDPSLDFGELTSDYHRLIKNTIKNHFKSASDQIKQYKKNQNFKKSGIVFLNTGYNSLPHELFKEMVTDILNRETKTIEFAFIFSQIMQTNGWNMISIFRSEWIGNFPNEIEKIKDEIDDLVNIKMSEMIIKNDCSSISKSQKPISN